MAEFVFPKSNAHCTTINGFDLIFSPAMGVPLLVNEAAFGLVQNCSGMSLSDSQDWLRHQYGESSVYIADEFRKLIEAGYFRESMPRIEACVTIFGICITHRCNMRCRYCFAARIRKCDEPEDMAPDTVRAAVDFVFDTLQPPWVSIPLGITGEPLLKWNAVQDVISYARTRSGETGTGVGFSITTNGMELGQEMLDYLRAHSDMKVALSWDGPREIHNLQRPGPDGMDTYERVSNAFAVLQNIIESKSSDASVPRSQSTPMVVTTVSGLNPDVARVFTHLFDKGVRDLLIKTPRAAADPAVALTESNLEAFKTGYMELAELLLTPDGYRAERLFTIMSDGDLLGRHILRISHNMRCACRCDAARSHFQVNTNGDIYPCPSLVGMTDFRMGNVHTGLDEQAVRSFREATFLPNIVACQDCWAKYLCGGPCPYVSTLTHGRSDIPYGPDCELIKHLIELAGYIVARLRVERPGLLEQVLARRSNEYNVGASSS